jgi:hypothetical protein
MTKLQPICDTHTAIWEKLVLVAVTVKYCIKYPLNSHHELAWVNGATWPRKQTIINYEMQNMPPLIQKWKVSPRWFTLSMTCWKQLHQLAFLKHQKTWPSTQNHLPEQGEHHSASMASPLHKDFRSVDRDVTNPPNCTVTRLMYSNTESHVVLHATGTNTLSESASNRQLTPIVHHAGTLHATGNLRGRTQVNSTPWG